VQWVSKAAEPASSAGAGAAARELAKRWQQARRDLQACFAVWPDAFEGAAALLKASPLDAGVQEAAAEILQLASILQPGSSSSSLAPGSASSPAAPATPEHAATPEAELPDMTTLTVPELVQWIAKAAEHGSGAVTAAAAATMQLAAMFVGIIPLAAAAAARCQARKDLQAAFAECPGAFKGAVVLLKADSLDASVQKAAAAIIHEAVLQHPSNASSFLGCEGALDSLAHLLSNNDAGIRGQAVCSLWSLSSCGNTACAAIVAQAGILVRLPLLLADPVEDVSRNTTQLVQTLASRQPDHQSLLGKPDIILPLANLLSSNDDVTQNWAAGALQALAAAAEAKDIIGGQTDAIKQLLARALGGDSFYSVRALQAIVQDHPVNTRVLHTACTLEGVLQALCGASSAAAAAGAGAAAPPSTEHQAGAASLLLLLLKTDRSLVATLVQQMSASPTILQALVGIVDTAGMDWYALQAAEMLQLVGDTAAMRPSIQQAASTLINSSNSAARRAAARLLSHIALGYAEQCFIIDSTDEQDGKLPFWQDMSTLFAEVEQPISAMYASDGLQTLVGLLQHTDPDIRQQAARNLMWLVTGYASGTVMKVMQTAGMHSRLLRLLTDDCAELRRQAAEMLGNLGKTEGTTAFYTAAGGGEAREAAIALLALLNDLVPEVRKEAMVALGHCFHHYSACAAVEQQHGAVDKLVQYLSSEDAGMREKAAFTYANLCVHSTSAATVGKPSTVSLLLAKLDSSYLIIHNGESEQAARALGNLVTNREIADAVYRMLEAMTTLQKLVAVSGIEAAQPGVSWKLREQAQRALYNINLSGRASGVTTSTGTTEFTADEKNPSKQMLDNAADVAVMLAGTVKAASS
jgi:hypothetical protein